MRQLGELEAVIMDRLWAWGRPALVREVVDDLQPDRPLAYTTVMTVMDNLHRKGALNREMDGRAYLYRPAVSREQHVAQLLSTVLDDADDRAAALMGFVNRMNRSEVAALRKALDDREARRRRR
jgi:predicted transcriptional regulator